MLNDFLSAANENLARLIEINRIDLEDIKIANHDSIFSRLDEKNALIASFESNKKNADSEMIKLSKKFPNKDIASLLDSASMALIEQMRENLKTLRILNKNYAKSVIAVREFYDSLAESIMPSQRVGYNAKNYNHNIINVSA